MHVDFARARTVAAAMALVVFATMAAGARQTPTVDASQTLTAAWDAFTSRDLDRAEGAFRQLLAHGREASDELLQGRGLLGLGSIAIERLRFDDAVKSLRQALDIFERVGTPRDVGETCLALGIAIRTTGTAAAQALFARASAAFDEAGDRRGKARAQYQHIRGAAETPDIDRRFSDLVADTKIAGDRILERAVLHTWGDRLFSRGDFNRALETLDAAAAVLPGDVDSVGLGTIYNSLGRLYRAHGQLMVALDYQLRALAIHEKQNSPYTHVQSLNAVAATYQLLGDLPHAKTYFERALDRVPADAASSILPFLRASYGSLLVASGEAARGHDLIAQALEAASPYYRTTRGHQLAHASRRLGDLDRAADEIDAAMSHCATTTRLECMDAQLYRASIALARGDEAAALADQQAVLRLIEEQHATLVASDFMKQGFAGLWTQTYSLAIRLQLRQGRLREALETAELGRSRALLDLLASRNQSASGRVELTPAGRASATASASLRRSEAVARPAGIADLVATAARLRSTLVIYWVGDDEIHAWTVAPDGAIHHATTPVPASKLAAMTRAIAAFGSGGAAPAIVTRGPQAIPIVIAAQTAWRELYDVLIQPVARYLPSERGARITIVPHGVLVGVPFAGLRDRQERYLVEGYAVHVAPAGGFFDYMTPGRDARTRPMSALLVADPDRPPRIPGEPPLQALPGADAEVRAIARLWPAGRATVLTGADATEPRVIGEAGRHAVLHFATHAVVRDANPAASFLALGRPSDGQTSGELTPDKIYGLSLDADLVVLSACRSGGGPPNGDGVATLARAFITAGTPSVIVSVWDVADAPTTRLLPVFYRAWLGGADKASALRTAQLGLIADLRAGRVIVRTRLGDVVLPEDPAFWAGFVLIGEAD